MSDLILFLRAEAWEHKDGIKKMSFRGKVTELNLWKAADRIEELEGIAHRLKGENMALAKANERLQDKLDIAEACIEELEAELEVRTANNVEYLARIKSMGLQNRINLEEITALEFELRG